MNADDGIEASEPLNDSTIDLEIYSANATSIDEEIDDEPNDLNVPCFNETFDCFEKIKEFSV